MPNSGQNQWFFVPCDLEIWWMTLKNNRTPPQCCFKLCAPFHSHWWIQTGVTVRKHPIWVKIDIFSHVNLKFDGMTLTNNRAPLSNIKLCASFHHQMCIQTGVTVQKQLSGVLFSVTDLWPLTLAFCTDITSVNGNNSLKLTGTLSKRCDGQTDAKKWGHPLSWLYIVFLQQSLTSYWEKRKDDSLMLATIRDDTCNMLNMQHIIPNSERWDDSDIPGGGHE